MDTQIFVATITVAGSLVAASLSYYLTKRHELRMDWRREKLNQYRMLLGALSDLAVDGADKDDANRRFAAAANTLALVASQDVITALMSFHDEVKFSNQNRSVKKHDELLILMLLAIRKDLKLTSADEPQQFQFHLIGAKPIA